MPMTWNAEADARLLVAIIATGQPKMDYDELAKYMGGDCTAYAIQHRIRKLKDKANGKAPGSASSTPSKRKKKAANKNYAEPDSDDVATTTPKKVKAEPTDEDHNAKETI